MEKDDLRKRDGNTQLIRIKLSSEAKVIEDPMEHGEWAKKVEDMRLFLGNGDKPMIGNVGLAVGIQNCLVDGKGNVYVGVRMKSTVDANLTSVRVAQGFFNTGYELVRDPKYGRMDSPNTVQDLFVTKGKWIKRFVTDDSQVEKENEIYKEIRKRVEAAGGSYGK